MFVPILCILCILLVILRDLLKKRTLQWKNLSMFPGNYPLPILGNALELGFDADDVSHRLMKIWRKHGKNNFRVTVGSENWIFLSNTDDVGIVLNHPTELGKPLERNMAMLPFFGNSVSTSEGDRWRFMRKMMTPSFKYRTLERRVQNANSFFGNLQKILDEKSEEGDIDMYKYLRPFMFDLLCNSLMGVNFNLLNDLDNKYLKVGSKVIKTITTNYFSYWRNIRPLFILSPYYKEMMDTIKVVRDTSTKIIDERRIILQKLLDETKNNNKNVNVDIEKLLKEKLSDDAVLLDKLLMTNSPNGDPISDETINEEISLVCFTGHYTTTLTMSHTLYCLAKYPEVQQRVFEEQHSIFNSDITKTPTNNDLSEMKYLEAVVKETMRVIPTLTKIGRQLQNDLELSDGRIVPAGSELIVFYEAIFSDPKTFPDPEKYNPDRFLSYMHQFAFAPFSAGPRNCIGFRYAWVAMKATLSNIIRRYEILPGAPGTEPQFKYRILTESENGVNLRLKKRIY